jgi:peroxiredoxin
MGEMLQTENLPLALALSSDAANQLLSNVSEVKKVDDAIVADKPYTTLSMTGDAGEFTVLLDPATHLLRQVTVDQKHYLESNGQTDVKAAQVVWDYVATTLNAPVKPDQFAWAPPADARDATGANNNTAMADDEDAAKKLEGKAAPDFKLPGLDGKDVALTDLKGSVVVLDFWATWCGPCRASLPHLDKLYQDNKATGVKIFAVNVDEDKTKVAPFIAETKLTVPVLLDSEQTGAGAKYGANAIPETVVIGKDGKVKKVIIGFDPSSGEEDLAKAIKAAMDGK